MHQYNKAIEKMINYNGVTKDNIKKHDSNQPQIRDHPYRILIISGFRSGKPNALLYLIKQQNDNDCSIIDYFFLYVRDLNKAKYQYLITNLKKLVLKSLEIQRFLLNIQMIFKWLNKD